ncbi:hypothetical protein [Sinimarinibacterium sp. NLF-5-8]|uniref:hypothetical protein n=1 Tax=Sinimarinibacterium sp. NLF-5-8 TaxID=2698684 RepID=UPI00137C03DD|nr:hypothetical protein [Sinimarinibacterium sp. NLF-5-8]QHS09075.1 hypothetical protein GT972_02205 [Sinimarinibacterium sp. NLF-5-8]
MSAESDKQNQNANPPTPKMLAWAQTVAERFGVDLPQDAHASFESCKAFLDEHKPVPPSQKQVEYAQRIAQSLGIELEEETLADYMLTSQWLDQNAKRT